MKEAGGERVQRKKVEAAVEARERQKTICYEVGEGTLEFAKMGWFTEEEEVRERVDGHGSMPKAVEEGGWARA